MGLLDMLKSDKARAGQSARAEYLALLKASPETADALRKLKSLAETLGLSVEEIEADFKTVQRVRALAGVIKNGAGIQGDRESAQKALMDHHAAQQAFTAKWREDYGKLSESANSLEGRWMQAQTAQHELRGLIGQHAELLAGEIVPELD